MRKLARANLQLRKGPTIDVWSEDDVAHLAMDRRPERGEEPEAGKTSAEHAGKYAALWAWLQDQDRDEIETSFSDLEEVIGMSLPPSCRKHQAHWHSYRGSAVVRAIRDAGWKATRVESRG